MTYRALIILNLILATVNVTMSCMTNNYSAALAWGLVGLYQVEKLISEVINAKRLPLLA